MECVLQWLDNLDDLVSMLRMQVESFRRIALALLTIVAGGSAAAAGILLAVAQPALAVALASVLTISVVYPGTDKAAASAQ